jgi:alpha-acetolactate decarboxylase
MTILNGNFYHFRSDGVVTEESDSSRVPFAVITTFRSEVRFSTNGISMDDLTISSTLRTNDDCKNFIRSHMQAWRGLP